MLPQAEIAVQSIELAKFVRTGPSHFLHHEWLAIASGDEKALYLAQTS